ncbi:MAG: PDZ domain-containing protein [Pirellula sp.]
MKKIVFCSILAISTSFCRLTWCQEVASGLLGGQGGGANNGVQPPNQGGGLRGAIREQVQNAIQSNLPGGQNIPSNAQTQGNVQINGQLGGSPFQSGTQQGVNVINTQQIPNNQQGVGTSLGSQLLGVLKTNLMEHASIGQDGTVRFRNDVSPQMRGMGILPNDQLIDSSGQGIRDLNTASSFLQSNPNLRVRRNGQIVTIQQSMSQSNSNTSPLGWSIATRNNGVFISSLVSNSIAAQAGLRAGDQILSINGNPVGRSEDVSTYMLQANNSTMTIVYLRNGQPVEAILKLSNQEGSSRIAPQSIQSKLDQIERLIGEIRAELSSAR